MSGWPTPEEAQRIGEALRNHKACVIACRGIPTKALEDGVVEKMVGFVELMSTHDLTMQEALAQARTLLQQIKGDQHG